MLATLWVESLGDGLFVMTRGTVSLELGLQRSDIFQNIMPSIGAAHGHALLLHFRSGSASGGGEK